MYDVYIDGMLLPVAPEKITTTINGKNETATLINDGEINILKAAGLTTISFTALFPNFKYPFAQYPNGFVQAGYYLDKLERLKANKLPFQFIITRKTPVNKRLFNTNLTCSLEGYSIVDDARNGFDVEVQITLKQFKAYATKTFHVDKPSPTAPIVVNPTRPASTAQTSGGGSSSSSSGKKLSSQSRTYKVQIPGMSVLSIKGTSVQDAIKKAMGTTWTGTVYVDGKSYYVNKGVLSDPPQKKASTPSIVTKAVNKVKNTVKKVSSVISSVIRGVTAAAKKTNTKPKTVSTPAKKVVKKRSNKILLKK